MHITCELPDVERTVLLRDMPDQNGEVIITLEELSTHVMTIPRKTAIRLSHHHAGLDGGSVNNDSREDLQQASQLLYQAPSLTLFEPAIIYPSQGTVQVTGRFVQSNSPLSR
jgi:hypothetical protein